MNPEKMSREDISNEVMELRTALDFIRPGPVMEAATERLSDLKREQRRRYNRDARLRAAMKDEPRYTERGRA